MISGSHSSANTARTAPSTAAAPDTIFEHQRLAPRVSRVQQDGEVAELLRNLMRRDRERRAHAKRNRRPHRGADDHPVEEVVKRIADDHHRGRHAVGFAVVRVAMPPEHELLQQEEQHDAAEQRSENCSCREVCQRFRQQDEKGDAKQRADGVADEPGHDRETDTVVKGKEG